MRIVADALMADVIHALMMDIMFVCTSIKTSLVLLIVIAVFLHFSGIPATVKALAGAVVLVMTLFTFMLPDTVAVSLIRFGVVPPQTVRPMVTT